MHVEKGVEKQKAIIEKAAEKARDDKNLGEGVWDGRRALIVWRKKMDLRGGQ